MIKPRLLPSHFEMESQSSETNIQEYRTSSNQQSFQTMFPENRTASLTDRHPVAPAFP